MIRKLFAGWAMALLMSLTAVPPVAVLAPAAGLVFVVGDSDAAWARRSSGGYSRPSAGFSRTPSFSGGYSRPRTPSLGLPSTRTPSLGSGDRAITGRGSAEALDRFRSRQAAPGDTGIGAPGGLPGGGRPDMGQTRSTWYSTRGWSTPGYALGGRRSFGIWDALFLWYMLDTLNRPGHVAFFHNQENDPGYQQWRQEAERKANDDPALRTKLDDLDRQLAAQRGEPRDTSYLPPGVPPEAAVAPQPSSGVGGAGSWLAIGILAATLFVLWRARQRRAQPVAPQGRRAFGTSPQAKDGTMTPLKTAAAILRGKLSGERYEPSLFRLGMTVTLDPTPFLLAAGATKVQAPQEGGGNILTSVSAVGTIDVAGTKLYRLHLPDERSFLQLHLDDNGQPDECRFFSVIDEVFPADADEWSFWLDDAEGMIGWPEFQTKDGKIYGRSWTPGGGRIPPRKLAEYQDTVHGMRIATTQAMLYAAPTGLADPAPPTEYILVSAVEQEGRAWVSIAAGIDINPASLSLA